MARGSNDISNASLAGWSIAKSASYSSGVGGDLVIFYKIAGPGESKTVSLTWTSSTTTILILSEWTGISASPLDQSAKTDNQSGNTSISTNTTPTTSQAKELLLSLVSTGNTMGAHSWNNGFSLLEGIDEILCGGYRIVSATGTYETTLSWTTTRIAGACIATFKGS